MIQVSDEFKQQLKTDNRNFKVSCTVTLKNGTVLPIDEENLWDDGFIVDKATSNSESFDIGAAITGKLTLRLSNIYNEFSEYDFADAEISEVKVTLSLSSGKNESVYLGIYTVNDTQYDGDIITLECLDNMYKFDVAWTRSKLTYPATLLQIVQDACSCCGVTLAPDSLQFEFYNYVIQSKPEDTSVTFRDVLVWVGQISGQYWKCNYKGQLTAAWYNMENLSEGTGIHELNNDVITDFNADMYDVTITGVKILIEAEEGEVLTYLSGKDGYVSVIEENKFITKDNGAEIAKMVGSRVTGLCFRPMTVSLLQDPTIEAGDGAIVYDHKLKEYKTFFTNVVFSLDDDLRVSNEAESVIRNNAERFTKETRAYQDIKRKIARQKSAVEASFENLKDAMKSIKGLYPVSEQQEDGSFILYLCDKPTLKESQVVIKMNAEGWGMSTDGGKTWNVGVLVNGTAIMKILNAIGINAEWINAGTIKAVDKDGNTTFLVDMDTGQVSINANLLQIKGKDFSSISKDQLDDFINNTYLSDILGIKSRLDGKIETWYQDKDPSLEWTRIMETPWLDSNGEKILDSNGNEIILFWESEKAEHEGDLWYNTTDKSQWTYISGEWRPYSIPDALLDKIDGKCTVWMQQPKPPYNAGDFWVITDEKGKTSLKTSTMNRVDGNFVPEDWINFKYVDADDVADAIKNYDTSLGQPEIFNKLTNGGKEQGIYIKDGKLYINATYILSGALAGNLINGRGLKVIDDDKKVTLEIDSKGNVSLAVTNFSLKGKSVEDIASEEARKKIEELPRETENLLKGYGLAQEDISKYWDIIGTPSYSQTDPAGQSQALQLSDLSAGDVFFSSKIVENPISAVSGRYNISFWLKGDGTIFTDYTYAEVEVYFNGTLIDTPKVQYWKKYSYSVDVSKMNSGAKLQLKIKGFTSIKHNICIYRPQVTFGYTSLDIFNMLTNNGELQGIYMIGDKLMLNGEYIKALSVTAEALASNSVTAEKILVKELSSLGATIAGFAIADTEIRRESVNDKKDNSLVITASYSENNLPAIYFGGRYSSDRELLMDAGGIIGNEEKGLRLKSHVTLSSDEWTDGSQHELGQTQFNGDVTVNGDFSVSSAYTKSIMASTENYGEQAYYCYETPTPTLGDFGGGVIGEDGVVAVLIDDVFRESTGTGIEYYVFLQNEGEGQSWVSEKSDAYFIVQGTPGLRFAWELKAKQKNKEYIRFNSGKEDRTVDFETYNLESIMFGERERIIAEMEGELL